MLPAVNTSIIMSCSIINGAEVKIKVEVKVEVKVKVEGVKRKEREAVQRFY